MKRPFQKRGQQSWVCTACGVMNNPQAGFCLECRAPRQVEGHQLTARRRPFFLSRRRMLAAGAVLVGASLSGFAWKEWLDWQHSHPVLSIPLDSGSGDGSADWFTWAADGKRIACAVPLDTDMAVPKRNKLLVVNATSGKPEWVHEDTDDEIAAFAWSPGGHRLALARNSFNKRYPNPSALEQNKLLVFDAESGKPEWVQENKGGGIVTLAWSPGGGRLALAQHSFKKGWSDPSASTTIQIWQTQNWKMLGEYPVVLGKDYAISDLIWAPDENRLAVALYAISYSSATPPPSSVQIWDALSGKVLLDHQETAEDMISEDPLGWSPDGNMFATGGSDGALKLWDTHTGATLFLRAPDSPPGYLNGDKNAPRVFTGSAIAILPDWSRAAIYISDRGQLRIQIWDMRTHRSLLLCQPTTSQPSQQGDLIWSPNGKYIAACSYIGNVVNIWDASSGAFLFTYDTLVFPGNLTWSPDSHFLAVIAYEWSYRSFFHDSVLQVFTVG